MKVRIKIIEKNNGTKIFVPQAKDKWSIGGILFSILTLIFFGRLWVRYYGLSRVGDDAVSLFLGFKKGDIVHCSDDDAETFSDYTEARMFLNEYARQKKSDQVQITEDEIRIYGEKIKKVKYIDVKNLNDFVKVK